jgi:hypothetical protein
VHAEVSDHPERHDAGQGSIQADASGLRRTVFPFKGGFCS